MITKYQKLYKKFITSRPHRVKQRNDGLEVHHILPRSLGGDNSKSNLIVLTPRAHFIAHMMLTKCYKGKARANMIFALMKLSMSRGYWTGYELSARRYEIVKKLYAKQLSIKVKEKFQDPIWKKKWHKANTKNKRCPDRNKIKAIVKEQWKQRTPEQKKALADKIRATVRQRWLEGAYSKRLPSGFCAKQV